jgi:hypothetical protein
MCLTVCQDAEGKISFGFDGTCSFTFSVYSQLTAIDFVFNLLLLGPFINRLPFALAANRSG